MNYVDLGLNLDKLSENEKKQFKSLFNKARGIKEVWKPSECEFYFCINNRGQDIRCGWHNDEFDNYYYFSGNCFQTSDEAEFYREKLIVQTELERFAFEHNFDIDTTNRHTYRYNIETATLYTPEDEIEKYVIAYDRTSKTINILPTLCELDVVQFTTAQIAKDAIKEIGKARILKYLFGIDE